MRCPTCLRLGFACLVGAGMVGAPDHAHSHKDPIPPPQPTRVVVVSSSSGSASVVGAGIGILHSPWWSWRLVALTTAPECGGGSLA